MNWKITYYRSVFKPVLLFFLIIAPFFLSAQITDNFTDGNFNASPVWTGHDTDFIVNTNHQLQLNSSGTAESYMRIANSQSLSGSEWNFWINLDFSPSSSNYARIYLASNQPNLSASLNGYYLQFGETLSNDQVELFRQSGTSSISVCRGTTLIANAFSIRVKVTRDNAGLWKLYVDASGGTNYILEASGTDNTHTASSYFGVYCKYTATNSSNFFFDEFYMYAPPDVVPASLDSVNIVSQNELDVYFSEALSSGSAQTIANYSVNNAIGYASAAMQDSANPKLVHLTFGNSFASGQYYTLTVTGVQDLTGNNTINATNLFLFFTPQANDVQINEILADLSPAPSSLPAYEYIELYNRTSFPATLKGWTLSDASSTVTIPDILIQPDSFCLLTSAPATNLFSGISVAGLSSFPSLNDTGDDLILRDAAGAIISVVFFRADWYNDPLKNSGGWSLEQIDPASPCSGRSNWKASADNSGGTPGRKNSVYASLSDIIAPLVSHVAIASSNSIQLYFDEFMDSTTLVTLTSYSVDNEIGNPISANPVEPDYTSVLLTFNSPITAGTIYTISVSGLKDCAGNTISSNNTSQFAIPEPVVQNDIVINEIMFDPKDQGVEWIEIYNRSDKIIDLSEVFLCSQGNNGGFIDISQVAPSGYLILPHNHIVLSTDAGVIKSQYHTTNTTGFIELPSIPSLNNDSDRVLLIDVSQSVIDKLHFNSSWHLPLLNDTKGFSLERVNYENTTQDKNNWHTASESVGGATPAYKNSQYTDGEGGMEVTLSPKVFSPDNDGYNDVLSISYSFDAPGMVGNIHVYDSRGRLEKTLVHNELLATSGTFFWDGITDEKLKARIGIYIIYFEAFDMQGNVKKYKKACVVGGKM